MDPQSREIADKVRSGEYFQHARSWYQAIYIAPIAERTFFLIVAAISIVIGAFGVASVFGFLPLTDHPPVLLRTNDVDRTVPELHALKRAGQTPNSALIHFFISNYVQMREGYDYGNYEMNRGFVRSHSDDPTFRNYDAIYNRDSKQSPAAILGKRGERVVSIQSISINTTSEPKLATVQFMTELEGTDNPSRTYWTAVLQFYYSELLVTNSIDPETGEPTFTTQDPQFQVVDYALTQFPAH